MKALVTGANGFIGCHVVRELLKEGMDVRVFVRKGSDLRNLKGLRVEKALGDIRNRPSLRKAMKGCAAVFHTAALFSLWARNDQDFYDINVAGTRNVLEDAMDAGVERIVYTSTVAAVGAYKDGTLADERTIWALGHCGDHYTNSKYAAETEALRLCVKGCPAVIVNPSAPVGARDIKPTPTGDMVVRVLRGQIPGYIDSGINIVDVEDVARGHLLAFRKGKVGERYILAGENLTVSVLFRLIAKAAGRRAHLVKAPLTLVSRGAGMIEGAYTLLGRTPPVTRAAMRMAEYKLYYTSAKAEKELGYTISPVKAALERAARWFRDHKYA